MREFHCDQVVAFRMVYAQRASPQSARGLGQGSSCSEWRAGYLQQNLRRERQHAADRYERTPGGDVKGCSKFEELFALLVPTANEHGNRQRKARPLAALYFRLLTIQPSPLDLRYFLLSPHLVCQSTCRLRVLLPQNRSNSGRFSETRLVPRHSRDYVFAFHSLKTCVWPSMLLTSPIASIFPCVSVCLHFSLTEGKLCHTISP
jgi:hypothetical protein